MSKCLVLFVEGDTEVEFYKQVVANARKLHPAGRFDTNIEYRSMSLKGFILQRKTIVIFLFFEYTICNRVARSLFDIGDQAETCAQLFYVKERFYGFEKNIDL